MSMNEKDWQRLEAALGTHVPPEQRVVILNRFKQDETRPGLRTVQLILPPIPDDNKRIRPS